ncbi:MAG: HD-GYP domain-containing protein [bacterium]
MKKKVILKETQLLKEFVDFALSIMEVQDPYTVGHQKRVNKLAVAIAKKLNLSEDAINNIDISSYVHDLGKLYIPIQILSKPGKLSKVELNFIKQHPQIGSCLWKSIEINNNERIHNIILQHHERLDGSGYPFGLKGKGILKEAQIVAVADVVEAMTSHRPYREALGLEAALKEIQSNEGSLYNKEIVQACIQLFKNEDFQFN